LSRNAVNDIVTHAYRAGYCSANFKASGVALSNKDISKDFQLFLNNEIKKYDYKNKYDLLNMCVKSIEKLSIHK
jgi:hypothetical protein